jgi:hypothetical protein
MSFWTGDEAKNYQQSTLLPGQEAILSQNINAAKKKGAGGAFGDAADYYRDLLSDDSETYNAMQKPEMRKFNEQIIPGISEQFSGAGGIGSSGFRNSATGAATDLSERLGAMRANLRQQGAAGLAGIGQSALGSYSENIHQPGTGGFLDTAAPIVGGIIGSFAGPVGTAVGTAVGNYGAGLISNKGSTAPMTAPQQRGQPGGATSGKYNLPTFGGF